MIKKEGEHLVNARIDVDYSKGKPKIKFDYPMKDVKKEATKQGRSTIILMAIWIIIGLIPFFYIYSISSYQIDYPSNCGNFSLDKFQYNKFVNVTGDVNYTLNISHSEIYGFNLTCDNKTHIFEFNKYKDIGTFRKFNEKIDRKKHIPEFILMTWFYLSIIVAAILNNLLTKWLVKQKWYQKWFPKAQAEGILFKRRRKKYYKFEPKDVENNQVDIPSFSNVELDYKTTGEFSDYLKSIRIREHKHYPYTKTKDGFKLKKIKRDNFKWSAKFIFSKPPKTGSLEVVYQ